MTDQSNPPAFQTFAVKRKRKFNEMACDSPVSIDDDEEDKDGEASRTEDSRLDSYSADLLEGLKKVESEEHAFHMIKRCLKEMTPQPVSQESNPKLQEKKKLIVDGIKKLISDNVLLKSAVRKLVEKEEKTAEKLSNFDSLLDAYSKVNNENAQLRKWVEILQYAVREKCTDKQLQSFFNDQGGNGVC